jgi:multicomponent Na+:H+ antiporter subunit F
MTATLVLDWSVDIALGMLTLSLLLTSVRVIIGPTLADRVLALDLLVAIAIGFVALIAISSGFALYVDIALALGLVGFLATAAFARYLHLSEAEQGAPDEPTPDPLKRQGGTKP